MTISGLTDEAYVIQVDSDLLALQPIEEVVEAYRGNRAFTQAGGIGHRIGSLKDAAAHARTQSGSHVQTLAEQALESIAAPSEAQYVRGSAGFAGFPRGADIKASAVAFSLEITQALGATKWAEWGSEQVTSNYVIANCPQALALDFARYPLHWAGIAIGNAALIHFVGSYRYHFGTYRNAATRVIRELRAAGKAGERPRSPSASTPAVGTGS